MKIEKKDYDGKEACKILHMSILQLITLTHLYKRVCPSVRPSIRNPFFNEPIMVNNGRKWLKKLSKCFQLVKKSS